jgi:hypothetical protein
MPWIYYTSLSPIDVQDNSFNEAFNFFLSQCIINKDKLLLELSSNQCYRFFIKTDGDNDKIICNDGKIFLRSKFLNNKNFKKSLIDYYRPLGVFVKGPTEIVRRDGSITNKWLIQLLPMYSSNTY